MSVENNHTHLHNQLIALERRLFNKELQLNAFMDITLAINNNTKQNNLYDLYNNVLVDRLSIKQVALFINDGHLQCLGFHGVSKDIILKILKKGLDRFTRKTRLNGNQHETLLQGSFDYVIPIYHKKQPLAVVLIGGLDTTIETELEEQVDFIQVITSIVAIAIENKRLAKQQIHQEVIRKELEMAGKMQTRLIAHTLPHTERLQMAGLYLPNFDVGGDYYDYVQLTENDVFFCIADISGQGMTAAMLMASFQSSIRTMLADRVHPFMFVNKLNDRVREITEGDKFITSFLGHYNIKTRKLTYVNAGHNAPLLIMPEETLLLSKGCTILGVFDKLPFVNTGRIVIPAGSVLFCYTDGLTELENEDRTMYEIERLRKFLESNNQLSPSILINNLLQEIIDFKGRNVFKDDISMLCAKFG
jgi:sigma-B regulation protein RsbU (phosphoserine phosphatase)